MKRTLSLLLLLVATSASGAPQKPVKPAPPKKEAAAPAVDPKLVEAAAKARGHFRKMASLCPGKVCEPANKELILEAEKAYVEACRACSTEERCESDRSKIRDNTSKRLGPCG